MAKFFEKLSTRVKHQAPDFVLDEHPRFLEFVKQYYTFMESAEISVTTVSSAMVSGERSPFESFRLFAPP